MDRFLIAPLNTGLQTDLRAWLIMDDAFSQLNNVYVFRGRLRKRFGSTLMGTGWSSLVTAPLFSRLRVQVGTIGAPISPVPGDEFNIGQMFSAGDQMFTVYQLGAPAAMLSTGPGTGTFNTTTGAFALAGTGLAAGTPIWWYPALPVMGLTVYEVGPINEQVSYGFDTRFAYVFAGGFWQRSETGGNPVWHGDNADFFWTTNWRGNPNEVVLFVSNFHVVNQNGAVDPTDDPIWTFDGTTWATFQPQFLTAGDFVETALIILPFKRRLVLLNTTEVDSTGTTNSTFPQRCRFSQVGSPFGANAWLEQTEVNSAGAGFVDAATEERIVSAEFIKDRLIVYFEESTWELAYTSNENEPFSWQKINTELGSEATFSIVPFDKMVLAIGNTGVHSCNGANVERIDTKIPDQIFNIADKSTGVARIAGIRDYFTEMVYWTFPSDQETSNEVYPNRILVYNYRNGSWSLNDDCITTWGYFEQQDALTWASSTETWEEANFTWNSGTIDTNFRQVIAGNQEGFVFIIDPDVSRNAPVMQITNITQSGSFAQLTIVDHTLAVGDFIAIENAQGVTFNIGPIFKVNSIVDADTVLVGPQPVTVTGTYTGAGTAARVSNINFLSKQWNPYVKEGRNVYLSKIDFGVEKTSDGEITIDYFPSATQLSMLDEGGPLGTNSIVGNNILETFPYPTIPLEQAQQRLWHPIYFQADGECIQLSVYFSDTQIMDPAIAWADFQLEGLILHTMKASYRLQ